MREPRRESISEEGAGWRSAQQRDPSYETRPHFCVGKGAISVRTRVITGVNVK